MNPLRPVNPSAEAAHRRALEIRGIRVSVERNSGQPPHVVTFKAEVVAMVQNFTPDGTAPEQTGYSGSSVGGITQGDRQFILMAEDLARKRFPLPLMQNDRIVLLSTGEKMNITKADADKRAMAGAIEVTATGAQ